MRLGWTLSRRQLAWVVLYSAIYPASLVAADRLGEWVFVIGALVSLPLVPFSNIVFWFAIQSGGALFAFLFAWLFNSLLMWLLVVQYIGYQRKRGIKTGVVKHIVISVLSATAFILFFMAAFAIPLS